MCPSTHWWYWRAKQPLVLARASTQGVTALGRGVTQGRLGRMQRIPRTGALGLMRSAPSGVAHGA